MNKYVRVIFEGEANESYLALSEKVKEEKEKRLADTFEIQLFNSINKKTELLKYNCEYGDKIEKKKWPKELIDKYKLTNLWRLDVAKDWRMLYTIKGDKIQVVCFILKIFNHKDYNTFFGYK